MYNRPYAHRCNDNSLALVCLCALFASPFLIVHKIKKYRRSAKYKSLSKRLEKITQRSIEALNQSRKDLWDTIKIKRIGESDDHWIKRLKKYGFTADGIHIKTGINYQAQTISQTEENNMDVKNKLKKLEGETFYTVTKKTFTYKFISENIIKVSRTNYSIHVSNFEKAENINPTSLHQLREFRGSSYVFGVVTDSRFN